MKKKNLIDIDDFDKKINSLSDDINTFQNLFHRFNIEYLNKISGTLDVTRNSNYYVIRDSIFFRYDSIVFHLKLLQSIQKNQYDILNNKKNKLEAIHNLDFRFMDQQFQLFDSIIFHTISLFDYLGNLIGLISKGEVKMKWDGIMNSINDKNNSFSKFEISTIIKAIHHDLVDKLYNYRSELIHYTKASGGFRSNYDFFKDEMKFKVIAPKKVCNRFHELKLLCKESVITLNYFVFWLIEKTLSSTKIIIESLIKHMDQYRKTTVGSEIFYFQPPKNDII